MIAKLLAAIETGTLWGVKLTLALAIPVLILWFLVGDYVNVRGNAVKGAAAFDYLQKAVAQQQQAAQPTPPPQATKPAPAPEK